MKRFLTLLLAAAMVLSFAACGDNGTTIRNENEEDNVKKDPVAAQYLQDLAVKTADYPVLPAMPNESELDEAFSTIDYDKMGADAYEKAQEKIWEDWDARSNAYYDALKALRSKGTSYPAAFLHFTQEMGTLLSAEENTVLSPANLYLAFAMLSETTDGDSRAQLLSLLGLENTDASRAAGNYVWRNLYGETSTGKTLLGSSVWLNENVPYNEETLRLLAEQYLASTFSAPMGDEKTDKAIGEWINENTGNLLQDAAGEIRTKPETVMLLLTTLYFKDQWRDEFWKDATKKDTFTAADGEKQTVERKIMGHDLNDCRVLGNFSFSAGTDKEHDVYSYSHQGHEINGDYIYFYEGNAVENSDDPGTYQSKAYVTVFNYNGRIVVPRTEVAAIADVNGLASEGFTQTGYAEGECIKVKEGKLYLGMACRDGSSSNRYANILVYDCVKKQ